MLYLGFVGHLRSLLNTLICLFTAFINVNTILSSLAVQESRAQTGSGP